MTARKSTTRARRRTAGATSVPKAIAAWFSGAETISFMGTSAPYRFVLADLWAAWLEDNPNAVPPDNLRTYLARDPAPGTHAAELRDRARKQLGITAP